MVKVVINPLNRFRGSLQVEVDIAEGRVVEARCGGLSYRGFEEMLVGRDPWDSLMFAARICSEESVAHTLAAALALEKLAGYKAPPNGQVMRNLLLGTEFLRAHIGHFYLEALGDFVPQPGENYWEAMDILRLLGEMIALFGGRHPHGSAIVPGGVAEVVDSQKVINFEGRLHKVLLFIEKTYLPNLYALKVKYPQYLNIGRGCQNLLAAEGLVLEGKPGLFLAGRLRTSLEPKVDTAEITEDEKFAWFQEEEAHPEKEGAYSWIKAPRYDNQVYEVGSLARMMIKKHSKVTGLGLGAYSLLGRHLARGEEALLIGKEMLQWLTLLKPGEPGAKAVTLPDKGEGFALIEAPGGMLYHRIEVKRGLIQRYQIITPSTWNLSSRDSSNQLGPVEQALLGLTVPVGQEALEAARIVSSFAPCAGCAAHLITLDGPRVHPYKVEG
ncbi:MAG: nickel-dependent hydrogenase large subunit [Clostridia bacterium]|nr:nickel-dependent hydrogenase large subunit [Clostridia bacterium]